MKTTATKMVERQLWNHVNNMSKFGAMEVQFGFNRTGRPGTEIIDCVTFETDGTIRCYEIKTSVEDLKYGSKPTFIGDYNYWVVTQEVYDWMKRKTPSHEQRKVGIFVVTERTIANIRRAKKRLVYMSDRMMIMESMIRSLNREVKKYYKKEENNK